MSQNNSYGQPAAYDQTPQPGNPTYTEAWALVEAARRMALQIEYGSLEEPEVLTKVRDAVRLNWRLWTIFQTELSLEDGPVPDDIRGNMLSLCNFVDKQSVKTINEPTVDRVMTLVEINRQIANGLLESLQVTAALSADQSPKQDLDDAQSATPIVSLDTNA